MIKIFYNTRIILLSKSPVDDNSFAKISLFDERGVKKTINNLLKTSISLNINVYDCEDSIIPPIILSFFIKINAAGGLITDSENRLLFIERLGYYDLPKGKCDPGESFEITAIREVCEECGILEKDIEIRQKLMSVYHIYPLGADFVLKETVWFWMNYKGNGCLFPQIEENISSVAWIGLDELDLFLSRTYPSLVDLINFSRPLLG